MTAGTAPRRGFTLLEVLVALAVVAIGLAAGVRSLGQAADVAGALADRSLARWVAEDHIALLRAQQLVPAVGTRDGHVTQDQREYHWIEISNDPEDSPFRRVEVHVRTGEDTADLASLTIYVLRSLR